MHKMYSKLVTEPADGECEGRALRHRSNEGSHYQNSLERERGIQRKIGRGTGKDNIHTEVEGREQKHRQTCMYTNFKLGWREEEEGWEEGQKESRGRNEGGRNLLFYNISRLNGKCGSTSKKTMPYVQKYEHTLSTNLVLYGLPWQAIWSLFSHAPQEHTTRG